MVKMIRDQGSGAAGFAGTSQMKQKIPSQRDLLPPSFLIPDLTYSGIERTFLKSALSRWIFSSLPMQQI